MEFKAQLTFEQPQRNGALSAVCEFAYHQILRLQRMSAMRAASEAWPRDDECPQWAVNDASCDRLSADAALHRMAAASPNSLMLQDMQIAANWLKQLRREDAFFNVTV